MFEPYLRTIVSALGLLVYEHCSKQQERKRFEQHQTEEQLEPDGSRPPSKLHRRIAPRELTVAISLVAGRRFCILASLLYQIPRDLLSMKPAVLDEDFIRPVAGYDHAGQINSRHIAFQTFGIAHRQSVRA